MKTEAVKLQAFKGKEVSLERHTFSEKTPESWRPYFKGVKAGAQHWALVENKSRTLLMSDTPIEVESKNKILKAAKGNVLAVGLGINLVNDEIKMVEGVKSVTTIELRQEIVDNVPSDHNVVMGDATKWVCGFEQEFDTIWWDATAEPDVERLKSWLKPGGKLVFWDGTDGS